MQTKFSGQFQNKKNTGFIEKVSGMASKIDYDGKMVTIILVVIALILVVFQLIR